MARFHIANLLSVFCLLGLFACASSAIIYETPLHMAADPEFECENDSSSAQSFSDSAKTKNLSRCAITLPEQCGPSAKFREQVKLLFNINTEGEPVGIRIAETTNECLNQPATDTLAQWRYSLIDMPERNVDVVFRYFNHSTTHGFQRALDDFTTN